MTARTVDAFGNQLFQQIILFHHEAITVHEKLKVRFKLVVQLSDLAEKYINKSSAMCIPPTFVIVNVGFVWTKYLTLPLVIGILMILSFLWNSQPWIVAVSTHPALNHIDIRLLNVSHNKKNVGVSYGNNYNEIVRGRGKLPC